MKKYSPLSKNEIKQIKEKHDATHLFSSTNATSISIGTKPVEQVIKGANTISYKVPFDPISNLVDIVEQIKKEDDTISYQAPADAISNSTGIVEEIKKVKDDSISCQAPTDPIQNLKHLVSKWKYTKRKCLKPTDDCPVLTRALSGPISNQVDTKTIKQEDTSLDNDFGIINTFTRLRRDNILSNTSDVDSNTNSNSNQELIRTRTNEFSPNVKKEFNGDISYQAPFDPNENGELIDPNNNVKEELDEGISYQAPFKPNENGELTDPNNNVKKELDDNISYQVPFDLNTNGELIDPNNNQAPVKSPFLGSDSLFFSPTDILDNFYSMAGFGDFQSSSEAGGKLKLNVF